MRAKTKKLISWWIMALGTPSIYLILAVEFSKIILSMYGIIISSAFFLIFILIIILDFKQKVEETIKFFKGFFK